MANSPYLAYEGFLPNPEANIGSALPAGSTYILKEIAVKNDGAGVNQAEIGTNTLATRPLVDESLPPAGSAGNWQVYPFSTVMAAGTQFRGLATTAAKVYVRISMQRIT